MTLRNVLSLDQARKEAKGLLGTVARDGDPLSDRRKEKAAQQDALRAVAEEFLRRESKKLRSIDLWRSHLERLVFPKMGTRQIADIKRSDIVRLLDHIEDERGPVMAQSMLAILRRIMNWHASRSDEFRTPIVRGMSRIKPSERARDRVLTDDELRAVWRTAEGWQGPWGRFVQFCLLTATRRNEAARMGWDELSGDDWIIPAGRYKTKRDHLVALSKQARALLADLPRIKNCPYVFTTDGRSPIAGFSQIKRQLDAACGVTGWTLHDLRRSARSLMSRAGVNADIAERCLGHALVGVRATYDRHTYREEMLRAFEALAAQIERIVHPQENVVALARK
jgi:integrase